MAPHVTASVERYLEGIYILQEKSGVARTSELAELLGVVSGTITNTVRRLKKDGLVAHQPYRGVYLTEEGHNIASRAIRKHQLLTRLLTDILGVELTLAYDTAFNITYYIPDEVITKIEKKLKTRRN